MREVNHDVNNSEALSKPLRSRGEATPNSAPPEIGNALAHAFRRHHTRRRVVRRTTVAAAIVILIGVPALLVLSRRHVGETPKQNASGTVTHAPLPLTVPSDLPPK